MLRQFLQQGIGTVVFPCIQVEMQDRIPLPLLFEAGNGKSVEKLFLSLKIRLKSTDKQAFPEPARAAQEIVPASRGKPVHKCCLVYIEEPVLAQAFEILYSYRIKLSHFIS